MTMLEAALNYINKGMAVFPIATKDKSPLTTNGFKDASRDPKQINEWWCKWPHANIGIATGKMSGGIYVIDLDIDDDKGIDGYQSFRDWQKEHGEFPDSWMVKTGRGGYHIYLRSIRPVRSRIGILEGVDIRGDGGYVVAPPSTHPNGRNYCWEYDWDDLEIAEADDLLDEFLGAADLSKNIGSSFSLPEIIPSGKRNDTLFKYACSLQGKGLTDNAILAVIRDANESQCEAPLSDDEVEGIVNSALTRYDKGKSLPARMGAGLDNPEHGGLNLRLTKAGIPFQYTENVIEILEHDSKLQGSICYNELAYSPFVRGPLPWDPRGEQREWNNSDDANLYNYIESNYGITNRTKIAEGLDIVVDRNKFNPVKNVLEALHNQWDRQPGCIERLLPDYMGVEEGAYSSEVMTLFMFGAIARIYHPGIKFDYMPVLVGKQGIGKSTFFRFLALDDKWYNDNFNTVEGDKAAEKLRGMWIVEMAELLATKRAKEVESIKAFLTSTYDTYRQPYSRRPEHRPRMCVFAGTTNSNSFLTDRTGNRRFIPLVANEKNIKKSLFKNEEAVAKDFANAWGEAMELFFEFEKGKPQLVLSRKVAEIAKAQQLQFTEEDVRVGVIQDWLDHTENTRVCACMIWQEALGYSFPPRRQESNEIMMLLSSEIEGWHRMEKKARCGKYGTAICYERDVDNNSEILSTIGDGFTKIPENAPNPFDDF